MLAKAPSIALASSILTPVAFAIGAAVFIASAKLSISRELVAKLLAITSVTRPVSSASKPKALSEDPATSAARPSSAPPACARYRVLSVTLSISLAVKPSLANSVCRPATSLAVNVVEAPSFLAWASNALNSLVVAPDTAFTLLISASKPEKVLTEIAPKPISGAEILRLRFIPKLFACDPKRRILLPATFKPLVSPLRFAPIAMLVLILLFFAISLVLL